MEHRGLARSAVGHHGKCHAVDPSTHCRCDRAQAEQGSLAKRSPTSARSSISTFGDLRPSGRSAVFTRVPSGAANVLTLSLEQLSPSAAVTCVEAFLAVDGPDADEATSINKLKTL